MLDTIRRHQQSWLTYLIFAAIIVVFAINFGPGSSSCRGGLGGTHYAASVDGDMIRQQDFALLYSRRFEAMRRRAQASNFDFSAEMAEKMGLKQQVLDQLIDTKLLAHEAERRDLKVTDEELLKHLEEVYRVKDVTEEQYRTFVERNFQSTVTRFEEDIRGELLGQKMARLLTENVTVGDGELSQSYLREHDRAMVDFVRFEIAAAQQSEPSAAEVTKLIESDAKAVEARYNQDALKYRTPEQRRGRQIMIKVAQDASDAEVAKARSRLLELKGQIDGGADFAALAKEHSQDDATKAQGGDMGWLKRGELLKPVEDASFALKQNEITAEPVRSVYGLHLVQITEVKPPARRELKEVEREVAASILREREAEAKAQTEANALLAQLNAGKALADLTITDDEAKADKDAAAEPADKAKDKANKDKGKGKDKGKAPAASKLVRHESPWILKAEKSVPGIGSSIELHDAVFTLTRESPLAKQVFKVNRAYYVVVLKERETPDLAKFEAERETLREQAVWDKRRRVFDEWMKNLRAHARIELNQGMTAARDEG